MERDPSGTDYGQYWQPENQQQDDGYPQPAQQGPQAPADSSYQGYDQSGYGYPPAYPDQQQYQQQPYAAPYPDQQYAGQSYGGQQQYADPQYQQQYAPYPDQQQYQADPYQAQGYYQAAPEYGVPAQQLPE